MVESRIRLLKVLVFGLCLAPLVMLLLEAFGIAGMTLGANPVEALLHQLGTWGLNFLLLTLAVTPLRELSGRAWLLRFRRMLGLFSFFYVFLHFLVYAGLDQRFDLSAIAEDIAQRPYITIGFLALFLLLPLAITSTRGMMRRLGRRWKQLHRLVYAISILAVWHFYWQVKLDTLDASLYAAVLAGLLVYRFWRRYRRSPALVFEPSGNPPARVSHPLRNDG